MEGTILLALHAIRTGEIDTVRRAAQIYGVPRTTLRRRMAGTPARENYVVKNTRLTPIEEDVLTKSIEKLDAQGLSPSLDIVREMADTICVARGAEPVGNSWAYQFIKRTPALRAQIGRVYECQRKQCEDAEVIRGWFRLVQNTIRKYGIVEEDIYNFDESGFQMGQISASVVVTSVERVGRPKQLKPTNTEWITLIAGGSATGYVIPPFVIMKGKELNLEWFADLPTNWAFTVSDNGWTTDAIGMQWIEHFERNTRTRTIGSKRLLILDNHGSHTTPEFRLYCEAKDIILLYMPPHSSHLLQPMDVGCFGPLKTSFSKLNRALIRRSIFHVTKHDFIDNIKESIPASLTKANILGGFRGAGLSPFDPEVVVARLDPVIETGPATPPHRQASWQPQTPSNSLEIRYQTELIQNRVMGHQSSSPAPILDAISQLSKGAERIATEAVLAHSQLSQLQETVATLQKRRSRKRKPIRADHAMTVLEAQQIGIAQGAVAAVREEQAASQPQRTARRCGRCREEGHTARLCQAIL